MRTRTNLFFSLLLLLPSLFLLACSSGGSKGPAPVGADLRGNWNAVFANPETGDIERFRASVTQVATNLIIVTQKEFPPGQMFTGLINSNGQIQVTDDNDGETWSTFNTRATDTDFTISDFITGPMGADDPDDFPLVAIRFTR